MVLNEPTAIDFEIEDIITNNLSNLRKELQREGVNVELEDFHYSFIDRVEELYIASSLLYGDEIDIPANFGVHRGYAGGGMHSGLVATEIDKLPKKRKNKAGRLLALFEKTFWQVLKDMDNLTEANTGEELEPWERQTI